MNLGTLKQTLTQHPDATLAMALEDGTPIAPHFHITEVGKVTKSFVDCGGTHRATEACVLQTFVADDVDHRIHADKLLKILAEAHALGIDETFEVEVEVQQQSITLFALGPATLASGRLTFLLQSKATACLAPDRCGIELVNLGTELPPT